MRNTPFAHPPVFGQNSQYGGGFGDDWAYNPHNPNSINYTGPLRSLRSAGGAHVPTRAEVEAGNVARAKAGLPPLPLPPDDASWNAAATDGAFVPVGGVNPDGSEVFVPNKPPPKPATTPAGSPIRAPHVATTGDIAAGPAGSNSGGDTGLSTFQIALFGLVGVASAYMLFFDKKARTR